MELGVAGAPGGRASRVNSRVTARLDRDSSELFPSSKASARRHCFGAFTSAQAK